MSVYAVFLSHTQDLSSSEQIAEEPSSGSFGSRPTSGINSPATTATPEEEEHDSFEASLHMTTTTESLSVARSSSISQTPQSSLDSMDSPKRQPSISSRESPLRGSVGDSPKRLMDSPKRQLRESPRRTPPPAQRSPGHRRHRLPEDINNGPADFSLTIPVEFQQQRLGSQPPHDAPVAATSKGLGAKPRRPMSYHVDPALPGRGGVGSDKPRPLRPLSSHVQPVTETDKPPSQEHWPPHDPSPSSSGISNVHEAAARLRDQTHLHENAPRDPSHLHEPRTCDPISLSQGHLARNPSSPVGRVLPQVRQPASPGELRRWESEHSYLQEEGWKPSRSRRDARGRGRDAGHTSPAPPPTTSRERQTLR